MTMKLRYAMMPMSNLGKEASEMSEAVVKKTSGRALKTIDLTYIGLFAALMAVCSWISIQTPWEVSFTMQTFGVFCTVGMLGLGRGTLAVAAYILLGLVGVPVFSGFSSGVAALLGSTGGYIIGFVFSALVTGGILKAFGKKLWVMILAMALGLIACYAFGTVWFMVVYAQNAGSIGLWTALSWCVFPYILPDLCKIALAILIVRRARPYMERQGRAA